MTIRDPHVSSVWVEIEIDEAGQRTILMAETDLQLDQQEIDYDAAKVQNLLEDLRRHRIANPYLDAIRVMRSWRNTPRP